MWSSKDEFIKPAGSAKLSVVENYNCAGWLVYANTFTFGLNQNQCPKVLEQNEWMNIQAIIIKFNVCIYMYNISATYREVQQLMSKIF